MARMYPKKLPDDIRNNPLRSAECEVYDKLKLQLDENFNVFYSSPWLGLTEDGLEIDGEADFTVAHPEFGMLVIEVKGGRIKISEDAREWTSTNRNDCLFKIKNPVNQARSGKHQLLKKLKESPDWKPVWFNAKHGVILNDTHRLTRDISPDMPLSLFAFAEDMDNLGQWIQKRFTGTKGISPECKPLGKDGIFALYMMLSHGIDMRVSLDRFLRQDKADIDRLTQEQYQILVNMKDNNRMAIAGAAGTGKTTLAVQKAIMCSEEGKRTLLVCYNEPLAGYLSNILANIDNLTVSTFHSLCVETAKESGLSLPSNRNSKDYFDKALPDLLFEAMEQRPDLKYQAVIIDEGQDFTEQWLQILECAVEDTDHSTLYIFYDNNQQVHQCGVPYIRKIPVSRWRLDKNLRNTRSVFDLTNEFYTGDPVRSVGPNGQPVSFVPVKSQEDDISILKQQIGLLVQQEKMDEDNITVLVSDAVTRDQLTESGTLGRYSVCTGSELKAKHVVVETVRRFKGLDSPVIILFRPQSYINENEIIYTGISRAQVKLIVIGDKDSVGFLKSKIPDD